MQSRAEHRPRPAGDVAITLLGGFAARRDGERVEESRWRLRKGRELVKLLALAEGHRLHREQLMDALWPELAPDAAANNLHQVVHVARRALGPEAVVLRDELFTLHASIDVEDFERAARQARRAGSLGAYRAALSLYRGELLPENRYDDWAQARREGLEQLHEELRQESESLGSEERASGLPMQASSFIGRKHELRELSTVLARTRLLTLVGAGGAGKTRLALELAREAEGRYPDGVAFAELAPVADGRHVAGALAAVLDLAALPGRAPLESVADFVAARSMLLILDNCEHLLRASAGVADALLRAAPGLTILATSREPLRSAGEVVFRVPSMAIPDPELHLEPQELLRYESVGLFCERATAAASEFELDAENAEDVARICLRLDGLPLALELAAARLPGLGTATLAERLDDRFRLLRAGSGAGPTRQQALVATLDWSHGLLTEPEKSLLRRLAVFAGAFDVDAVELVCAADGLDPGEVLDLLARLVEKSLVGVEPAGRELRYRLLETVRMYARDRLELAGEHDRFVTRHAGWALALAEREGDSPRLDRDSANLRVAHDALLARDPREALRYCIALTPFWLRRIDLEEAHDRASTTLAAVPERDALRAAALLAASAIDLRAGALARGIAHATESHEIAGEIGDALAQWRALQRLGELAVSYDDGPQALEHFGAAWRIAEREGLPAHRAVSVYSRGVAHWLLGDLAGAEEALTQSADCFRALADSKERIPSLLNIAEMRAAERSARPVLRIVFEETLHPLVESSCDAAAGYVAANQATIARLRNQPQRARELLEESARRFEQSGNRRGRADVLVRSAFLALNQGEADVARERLNRALQARRELRDRRGVGMALTALGLLEVLGGEPERAEEPLSEARELFRRAGDRWGLVSALWRTADLAIARGRLDEAGVALEEARAVAGATDRQRWIGATVAMLADVARSQGERERAAALFERADEHFAAGGDAAAAAAMRSQAQSLSKDPQRARKATADSNAPKAKTKRRQRT